MHSLAAAFRDALPESPSHFAEQNASPLSKGAFCGLHRAIKAQKQKIFHTISNMKNAAICFCSSLFFGLWQYSQSNPVVFWYIRR